MILGSNHRTTRAREAQERYTKPRSRRAESITQDEVDVHHWLARLAVVLSIVGEELPKGALGKHVRKTLDEFCASTACSDSLAGYVKEPR